MKLGSAALAHKRSVVMAVVLCASVWGCDKPSPSMVADTDAPVSVAGDGLPLAAIASVSREQGIAPRAAAEALVADALFARALAERQPELSNYLRRIGLARVLSAELLRQAQEQGPPNDRELSHFTERYWWQLDRPRMSRVTHVVVRFEEDTNRVAARQMAASVWHAVQGTGTKEQFRAAIERLPTGNLDVRVEDLLPVAPDGRVFDPDNPPPPGAAPRHYDVEFARAASEIETLGAISDVIETSFGYHVLMLTERLQERRLSAEDRRARLAHEVHDARARQAMERILEKAREELAVEIHSSALARTEGLLIEE